MKIVKAQIEHIEDVAPLFDGYRVFYKQESNIDHAKTFLKARILNNESVIYIAYNNGKAVGFTQLYPLFSSVSMERMYILNDLFVSSDVRGKGVGHELIQAAKGLCIEKQYKGLGIQTANDNPAQHLYQRLGFVKDPDLQFFWTNTLK